MRKDPDNRTEENALSRWSRRKADASRETGEATVELPVAEPAESSPPAVTDDANERTTPQKVLTDKDMPPLESLGEDSDYSGFLSPGVSEALRKVALRKLFRSAGFNVRDGLDDYDDDFRNFEALGDLVTCDMRHQEEMRELRRRQAEEERLAQEQAGKQIEEQRDGGQEEDNENAEDAEEIDAMTPQTADAGQVGADQADAEVAQIAATSPDDNGTDENNPDKKSPDESSKEERS